VGQRGQVPRPGEQGARLRPRLDRPVAGAVEAKHLRRRRQRRRCPRRYGAHGPRQKRGGRGAAHRREDARGCLVGGAKERCRRDAEAGRGRERRARHEARDRKQRAQRAADRERRRRAAEENELLRPKQRGDLPRDEAADRRATDCNSRRERRRRLDDVSRGVGDPAGRRVASCTARRAEDTAAHLVDNVLPRVPYRQWVFTFPMPVRLALSRRPHLVTAALQACLRVLFSWQRRRLRRRGVEDPSCGAITFVQRFGSALQLNVHFHVLVPDGGFDDDGAFVADEAPNDDDVRRIMVRASRRVMSKRHSFFEDDDERRREIDRLLQSLDAASATLLPVLFARDARRAPLSAFIEGFSLHAATRVMASDRRGLWRLCAYGARGAVKRALPDGRRQLVMTGAFLLEKIVP
jgi:hypothetical protein